MGSWNWPLTINPMIAPCIIILAFSVAFFVAGQLCYRSGIKALQKALVRHQEAKELLDSCRATGEMSMAMLEDSLVMRETGRAMWVMAQAQAEENREGDDWKV